jgi:hypothetical protein
MASVSAQLTLEQPMLKGMSDLVDLAKRAKSKTGTYVSGLVGSFVPTFVNDVTSAFDPYRRDPRPDGISDALWMGAAARLPGLRLLVPKRRDVLGRFAEQDVRAVWDPTIGSQAKHLSDPVLQELLTHDVGVAWPQRKPDEPKEMFSDRARKVGEAITAQVASTIRQSAYAKLSREDQTARLEKAIAKARELTRVKTAKKGS